MLKQDELTSPTSCINKAQDDEPVFVLRAQDRIAPYLVDEWARFAASMGTPEEKVQEAKQLAAEMNLWQDAHPERVKVPD